LDKTLPKGLLGRALGYLNKNWEKLIRYTEDGEVNIDNNLAENATAPSLYVARTGCLAQTHRDAHASAAIYSLIETAKSNGVEPYSYLREEFARLPSASSDEELQAPRPWNVSRV
jgi:transposase